MLGAESQRRLPGFDDKVLALHARGMTTREIQGHLEEVCGVEVPPSLISTVTDAVLDEVKACQARPLGAVYPIVFLDAIHVRGRVSGHVQTQAVYLALALTPRHGDCTSRDLGPKTPLICKPSTVRAL